MTDLAHNLAHIQHEIQSSCSNRDITLIAVSKKQSIERIKAAHSLGLSHFGENYAQELEQKAEALKSLSLVWHFMGPIQSNKTKIIAQHAHWVHSLDRLKIVTRLNEQAKDANRQLQCLIQVNIDGEAQKGGVAPNEITALAKAIEQAPQLTLRGLMLIPEKAQDSSQTFAKCRELFNTLADQFTTVDTLSMGMSNDYAQAIQHGSTMVRIGTALMGERPTS